MSKQDSSEETLKALVLRQEEAISELNERIRARDAIVEEAIREAAHLHHSLNEMYLRMMRARFTRP